MGMMALFSVSHAELGERERAIQNQEFFTQLVIFLYSLSLKAFSNLGKCKE